MQHFTNKMNLKSYVSSIDFKRKIIRFFVIWCNLYYSSLLVNWSFSSFIQI